MEAIEIKGKVNTALCYAKVVEDEAIEQGRKTEIQDALKRLHWQIYESSTSMPEDLCYLEGKYLDDYLHDVEICQAFARRSRENNGGCIYNLCK